MSRLERRGSRARVTASQLVTLAAAAALLLVAGCAAPATPNPGAARPAVTTAPAVAAGGAASAAPSAPAAAPATTAAPAAAPAAGVAPLSSPVKVQVGVLQSTVEGSIYLAIERGYFRDEGLDVELTPFRTSSDMIAPLASGELDVGNGGVNAGLFNAIGRGIALRIVADQATNRPEDRTAAWMVRAALAERVREPRDLRGLVVALGSTGTTIDVELDTLLDQGGLTRDDIEIKVIGYGDQVSAFANGAIDLAYTFEPIVTRLEQEGLASLWKTSGEIVPNHMTTVLLYGAGLVEQKPEAGRRFMVGYLRGTREYQREVGDLANRRMDTVNTVLKYMSVSDLKLWEQLRVPWTNPDGRLNRASLERDYQYFIDKGLVQSPPALNSVVDESYVDYALGRLGRSAQ